MLSKLSRLVTGDVGTRRLVAVAVLGHRLRPARMAAHQPGSFQQALTEIDCLGNVRRRRTDRPEIDGRILHLIGVLGDRKRIVGINPFFCDAVAIDLHTVAAVEVADVPEAVVDCQLAVWDDTLETAKLYHSSPAVRPEGLLEKGIITAHNWMQYAVHVYLSRGPSKKQVSYGGYLAAPAAPII